MSTSINHSSRASHARFGPATPALPSSWKLQLFIVMLAAGCLFFAGLGSLPLVEPDEGRNAEVAREMLSSGDWITPHFDTLPYLDKPAFFFWLVAGSMRIFGISEWAARLPSALMALATATLVWILAVQMFRGAPTESNRDTQLDYGNLSGLIAAIVWCTSPLVIVFAREVILDMTLTLLITLTMVCFWVASRSQDAEGFQRPWLNIAFFGSLGLATFVKGPVGFVLPLLAISIYQALRGRFRQLRRLRWGLGLPVFLAFSLPWFIFVSIRNPAFPRYALWNETVIRLTTDHLRRSGGPFYYLPVFLGGFFPWSVCLVIAGWNRLRRWKELEKLDAELYLLVWMGVVLLFFSVVHSKLPGYILPAAAPVGILMGRVWTNLGKRWGHRPDWLTATFTIMIGVGILVAASPQLFRFGRWQVFARHRISPNVLPLVRPELFFTGLILAAIGILGRNLAQRLGTARSRPEMMSAASFVLLAATVPLLLVRWSLPLRGYAEANSSKQLAREIEASPQRAMPIYGYFYFRTSVPFYLRRPAGLVTSGGVETTSNYIVSQFPKLRGKPDWQVPKNAPPNPSVRAPAAPAGEVPNAKQAPPQPSIPVLIDSLELQALPNSLPFLVMARNRLIPDVNKIIGPVRPLWSAWDYSVVEVPTRGSREAGQSTVMIDRVVRRNRSR